MEINPALSEIAQSRLALEGIKNVTLYIGDGATGWSAAAPYDVIVYTGSTQLRPIAAEKMLTVGGRLFVVTGEAPIMYV